MAPLTPIRVLVVDGSPSSQRVLRCGLEQDPRIVVIATAADPYEARDLIVRLEPDLLTLDIDMPRMDGVQFLQRLMPRFPLPVVMVTGENGPRLAAALAAGALDAVFKPGTGGTRTVAQMMAELRSKVRAAAAADVSSWRLAAATATRVVALGASTGGTDALEAVLSALPETFPGVLIVQHMPRTFTGMFAQRLHDSSALSVREAADGDRLQPGTALVAPGDQHMVLERAAGGVLRVRLFGGQPVSGHRPSVDVMMGSVAREMGALALGALLTGMGRDGAAGLLAIRRAGGRTLAQDEATSVVYGMPRVAWSLGAAERRLPLHQIPAALLDLLRERQRSPLFPAWRVS